MLHSQTLNMWASSLLPFWLYTQEPKINKDCQSSETFKVSSYRSFQAYCLIDASELHTETVTWDPSASGQPRTSQHGPLSSWCVHYGRTVCTASFAFCDFINKLNPNPVFEWLSCWVPFLCWWVPFLCQSRLGPHSVHTLKCDSFWGALVSANAVTDSESKGQR